MASLLRAAATGSAAGLMAGEKIFEEQRAEAQQNRLLSTQFGYQMTLADWRADRMENLEKMRATNEMALKKYEMGVKTGWYKSGIGPGADGSGVKQASQNDIVTLEDQLVQEMAPLLEDEDWIELQISTEPLREEVREWTPGDWGRAGGAAQGALTDKKEFVKGGKLYSTIEEEIRTILDDWPQDEEGNISEQKIQEMAGLGKITEQQAKFYASEANKDNLTAVLGELRSSWADMHRSGGRRSAGATWEQSVPAFKEATRQFLIFRRKFHGE